MAEKFHFPGFKMHSSLILRVVLVRVMIFLLLEFPLGGLQLLAYNRAGSGKAATVFRVVSEESVLLMGWEMSMSPAL